MPESSQMTPTSTVSGKLGTYVGCARAQVENCIVPLAGWKIFQALAPLMQ